MSVVKQPIPKFRLSKQDWILSRDKWKGILTSLESKNEEELLTFFNTECGYCDEAERSWEAVDVDTRDLDRLDYCKYCPLSQNHICIMGDSDGGTSYWKVADVLHDIEVGTDFEGITKAQMTMVKRHSQKILDAILASKPKRFRPDKE